MSHFDVGTFRATPVAALGKYVESLGEGFRPRPEALSDLIDQINSFGELHALYVAIWAVEEGVMPISDIIVGLIRRSEDRGGQFTLTRVLGEAKDLSERHIEQVRAIHEQFPHFILQAGIDELTTAWNRRQQK